MSISCTTVKIEPVDYCTLENEGTIHEAAYSQKAMDLSIKNPRNSENIEKPETPEIHTEFVYVKTEGDLEESLNEELGSDIDDYPLSKWYSPEVQIDTDSTQNGGFIQVTIKKEESDDDGDDSDSQPLGAHRGGPLSAKEIKETTRKPFECPDCGKCFKTASNLGQHSRTHLEVKPFKCDICQRQFAVKANFLKHQAKVRCKVPSKEPLICHVCDKVFTRQYLLQSHLKKHNTERPFSCERCDMRFKYKSTLMRHIQLHNGIKPFSCSICSKTFTHAGLIKPHMRKHTGEKPYPCPICGKLFAHKHNMERHILRHAKVKHLDCHICHKRFPKESRLKYHMRTHSKVKPFPCEHCPKRFSHKQNALRHYASKHPGEVYAHPETDAGAARKVWRHAVAGAACRVGGCRGEFVLP